jgi:sporulation protein YlmC with PRC-barrel domain
VKPSGPLKLVSGVRDLQIVDSEARNCGIVDDIELEGRPGGPLRIKGLVVGPGGYAKRLPGWWMSIVRLVAGSGAVRVPWEEVETIASAVRLRSKAEALGLARAEAKAERLLPRVGGL